MWLRNCYHEAMNTFDYINPDDEFGQLQRFVDALYVDTQTIDNIDVQVLADMYDFDPDLMEIIRLLPSGYYDRPRLADQFNSALSAHGWTQRFGTVE